MNEYEDLRKRKFNGFAVKYLYECTERLNSHDQIDIDVYTKLIKLDSRLGTTASEQLTRCLQFTTRSDMIKVQISHSIYTLNHSRLSTLIKSVNIAKRICKKDLLDLLTNYCRRLFTKNQSQRIKLILKFILSLFNWMQDLVQQLQSNWTSVFNGQLDPI